MGENMVKFKLKVHPEQGLMYIKEELREILGNNVIAIPNAKTVVMFTEGEDIQKVIDSLKIIQMDLELRKK
jgi:hypothetical protein